MQHSRAAALLLASLGTGLCFPACSSAHDELSREYLVPAGDWLVEPHQLGLDAEAFELPIGSGSLTGFFVRAPGSQGRTVLLFHGNAANVSMLHPYYTFLVEAGLNVCVFDYRGFGQSKGEPNVRALFYDMPTLLDWLHERPDVDTKRIAFYGLSLGSIVALHAAATNGGCAALVVENVPSPRDALRERITAKGQIASAFATGFAEFVSLPEGAEPAENSPKLSMPSLWIGGADEPRDDLRATLRAYFEMKGDKQLWVLPGTGHAPHSLLTHDGEYQYAVARFLRTALDGAPEQVAVSWRRTQRSLQGAGTWEFALTRRDGPVPTEGAEPWAVQVCALDADGIGTWGKAWLEGKAGSLQLELQSEPGVVSAMRVHAAERTVTGTFAHSGTPLSRAGKWYEEQLPTIEALRSETGDLALRSAHALATAIRERETIEKFPPLLETQLADVFALLGSVFAESKDAADKAAALAWLKRAVAAEPAQPARHYWPGRKYTAGFPQKNAVEGARALLTKIEGR